jgi:hypothetical protein
VPPGHVSEILRRLKQEGFIRRSAFRWKIGRDIKNKEFRELLEILNVKWETQREWPDQVRAMVDRVLRDPTAVDRAKVVDVLAANGPEV